MFLSKFIVLFLDYFVEYKVIFLVIIYNILKICRILVFFKVVFDFLC